VEVSAHIEDMRRWDERWQGDNYTRNVAAVEQLQQLGATEGMTVAQLALGWLLAQGNDIVPIFGTKHRKRLEENVGAAGKALAPATLERVKEILPEGSFGSRYPARFLPTWT